MWNDIKTDSDIKQLFNYFGNFHDSCIVSINIRTGLRVDNRLYIEYGSNSIKIVFQRQNVENNYIEIEFNNVTEFGQPPIIDNLSELFDARMFFYDDKLYWGDSESFNVDNKKNYKGLYISSKDARWRKK